MNGATYEVTHWEASSPPQSHPFWDQIRLRILFLNALSLCSSLKLRDRVPQPYSIAKNIIVLYVLLILLLLQRILLRKSTLLDLTERNANHISRRTVICQSVAEVWLIVVASLVAVSRRFIIFLF